MVVVSCSGKFHAFALAEQMQRHDLLNSLFTTYAYNKNTFFRRFVKRIDKEAIPVEKIHTNISIAIPLKLRPQQAFLCNSWFDKWVAKKIATNNSRVFIGWSGMSLKSLQQARKRGMITIIERGSSHISFQNQILKEEYSQFNKSFQVDNRTIEMELKEYEQADYISIPSQFVKKTFLDQGIAESKLIVNAYGAGNYFKPQQRASGANKFTIVYLGTLSVRKGLIYLFKALQQINIPATEYQVHFIGHVDEEFEETIGKFKQQNWQFFGHINHYDLAQALSSADVAVHPSIEEGMSMVILQLLFCGIPVIATTNTGGEDLIDNGVNGFIVPIRSPEAIAEKISLLFNNKEQLSHMKKMAVAKSAEYFTWDNYGNRYAAFMHSIAELA
jgi:glycosyltransferase involved in cell wall biosynthesis